MMVGRECLVQRKLGHAGVEMTSRYVHLAPEKAATIEQIVARTDKIDVKSMRAPRSRKTRIATDDPRWGKKDGSIPADDR